MLHVSTSMSHAPDMESELGIMITDRLSHPGILMWLNCGYSWLVTQPQSMIVLCSQDYPQNTQDCCHTLEITVTLPRSASDAWPHSQDHCHTPKIAATPSRSLPHSQDQHQMHGPIPKINANQGMWTFPHVLINKCRPLLEINIWPDTVRSTKISYN